jgi:hypothetical protein
MTIPLITNYKLIEETSRTDDLLGFDNEIKKFEAKLLLLQGACTLGFVGGYGVGKSVLLHQVEKKMGSAKWINFDAWKYNDKKDLWEGFVLDFAEQISDEHKTQSLNKIDGKKDCKTKAAQGVFDVAANFLGPFSEIAKSLVKPFYEAYPATRVFEIQKILANLIECGIKENDIYIVVEDVDRSGQYGVYFLETLKQFLDQFRKQSKKKIVVIVPISDKSYKHFNDAYLKCLDYVEFFKPIPNFKNFLESVINKDVNKHRKVAVGGQFFEIDKQQQMHQITSFFEVLFKIHGMTPRMLKNILRLANHSYIRQQEFGYNPDWRLTICIEAAKHFYTEYLTSTGSKNGDKESFFDQIVRDNRFDSSSHKLFFAMIHCVSSSSFEADKVRDIDPRSGTINWYKNTNLNGHATFVDKLSEEHFNKDIHTIICNRRDYIEVPRFYLDY